MPQAVWTGDLSFGLVNIPVKLYSATSPKQVRFHQYEAGTGRRIRYARVATGPSPDNVTAPPPDSVTSAEPEEESAAEAEESPAPVSPAVAEDRSAGAEGTRSQPPREANDEPEVPWEEVVKGYEIEPGRVVTVSPEELASLAPERSRLLEIEQFVDLADIDPVYFEKSYYIVPQLARGVERPYWLLFRAMEESAKVAVGRFVMRTKEYLAAVRPAEHVLMLETLFYADEVRDAKEVWAPLVQEPSERELGMARNLIDALSGDWDPSRHRDKYRERLLELLHDKADEAIVLREEEPDVETVPESLTDLMKALEASVEAAKQSRMNQQEETG